MSTSKPSAATGQQAATTLQQRLIKVVTHVQFAWFIGHVVLLSCAARYWLAVVTFKSSAHVLAYRSALVGSVATYGVVIFKTYSRQNLREINLQFLAKVWSDENVQYLFLALYWLTMARPVALALVPYVIFSLFHVLTYLRTTILPAVDPKSTSEADNGTAAMVSKRIGIWVKANYERAMQLAARVEVVLLGLRVVLGLVIRSTTLTTLLVYVGFLRYRFATSPFVRQQFSQVNLVVDHTLADPRVPPAARDAWRTFTNLVSTYFGGRAGKNPAGPAASSSSR